MNKDDIRMMTEVYNKMPNRKETGFIQIETPNDYTNFIRLLGYDSQQLFETTTGGSWKTLKGKWIEVTKAEVISHFSQSPYKSAESLNENDDIVELINGRLIIDKPNKYTPKSFKESKMKDNDLTMLQEKYANIYSGNVDDSDEDEESEEKEDKEENHKKHEDSESEDEEKEEHESDEDEDKEEKHEDSESEDEEKEEHEDDSEGDNADADEESESSNDDSEESSDGEAAPSKEVQNKIQALKKQYNDILVKAFTDYAPECIEMALDESETSFGENVENILSAALEHLKTRILSDFGLGSECGCELDNVGTDHDETDLEGEVVPKLNSKIGTILKFGEATDEDAEGFEATKFGASGHSEGHEATKFGSGLNRKNKKKSKKDKAKNK